MNMYLITIEVNLGDIGSVDYTCHGYYINIFSSSTFTLQPYLNIDGQFISTGEVVCEGNYFFPININSNCCASQKINHETQLYV